MRRRALLETVGGIGLGGLAGCIARTGTRPDGPRRIGLAEQDVVPDEHRVSVAVEVLEPAFTEDHPARVRITTTNEGDRRAIGVGTGKCALFNRSDGASDAPVGLWLYRPERAEDLERKPGKWVRDRPADQPQGYPAYGCLPIVYDAGGAVRTEYEVWDDYRVTGYLDPGTYRWETEIPHWEGPEYASDDAKRTFTWGFSLALEQRS